MKIGFISIGAGGTMGHMTFVTSLSNKLAKSNNYESFIFSEDDYKKYSNIKGNRINYIQIKKQPHTKSVSGNINFLYRKDILEKIKSLDIKTVVFSTFFDPKLIQDLKKMEIKIILHTFILRDSHLETFKLRRYSKLFDAIFVLKDLYSCNLKLKGCKVVRPLIKINETKNNSNKIKNILIVPGGGGRPSSKIFFEKAKKIIKMLPEINFTVIERNSKRGLKYSNSKSITWSNNFLNLAKKHDLIICEAGYNTVMETMSLGIPAILVPGMRRIDNQELRATRYESLGCGYCLFPEEDSIRAVKKIKLLIENPKKMDLLKKSINKIFKKIIISPEIQIKNLENEKI